MKSINVYVRLTNIMKNRAVYLVQ